MYGDKDISFVLVGAIGLFLSWFTIFK